ncbi:MAG: thiamine phosphate synthase, partial [Gemmatimonadota bacterium]
THPGAAGVGLELLEQVVALGLPTFAIGGVTANRAGEACRVGAWGVAAISAAWDSDDPYAAARALVAPWQASYSGGS